MKQRSGVRGQGLGILLVGIWLLAPACAQEIRLGGERPVTVAKGHVTYAPEVAQVVAGKASVVELRFKVDEGFHVNSHTPLSDLLIPTVLNVDTATSLKVLGTEYPRGVPYRLQIGDGETLDVYQGEFRVRLKVVAARGESTVTGGLRYQACDRAACYPPRTLPVSVVVVGK